MIKKASSKQVYEEMLPDSLLTDRTLVDSPPMLHTPKHDDEPPHSPTTVSTEDDSLVAKNLSDLFDYVASL